MKENIVRILVPLLLGGCLLAGTLRAENQNQSSEKKEASQSAETQATAAAGQDTPGAPSYKIGPQDVLKIDVWKEDQLTRTVPVRPDGKITLPLLNDVQAAGLTPMELAGAIREGLKKYLNEPQVTVTVTEINSRRIFVTGEVMRAGAFPLIPNMTILQALSTCGGFTQFARVKNIYVLRTESGKQVKHPFNYKEAVSGNKPEENFTLKPGDVIVVP
ncbi:MAG: polysaccharide biosynthesis/export family protein [Candidatus Acidiferrum sp.]